MYEIVFSEKAQKQLIKLNKDIQKRIISVFERIRMRPEAFIDKLVGEPGFKIRIGDYRAILDIDYNKLIIFVLKVGHRKNIYDFRQ